jgi:predicted dehydrogenase
VSGSPLRSCTLASRMRTSRIYLIGAGVIAQTHAAAVNRLPNASAINLVVADPDHAALERFAERFPLARTFSDAVTMLAEPSRDGDIVVVATPPFTHAALTSAALGEPGSGML